VEQLGHGTDDVENLDGRNEVLTHAAPGQLAVEDHVVDVPDDEHLGSGITDIGERVELSEERAALARGLEHDHVRRRSRAVRFEGRGRAAHLDLDVCLLHPAVARRGLQHGRNFGRLAEGLHGHPRHRRDRGVG
jgi:hypothetical protein